MPVLIEVNVAGEESKFGLSVEEVLPFLEEISSYEHLQVKGLMTIAPFVANPEENREVFQKLKKLSVDIAAKNINNVNMSVLSMGMTNDYQVAVEEGATMVRVGTGIFGERDYSIKKIKIRLEIKMGVLDKFLDAIKLNDDYDDDGFLDDDLLDEEEDDDFLDDDFDEKPKKKFFDKFSKKKNPTIMMTSMM